LQILALGVKNDKEQPPAGLNKHHVNPRLYLTSYKVCPEWHYVKLFQHGRHQLFVPFNNAQPEGKLANAPLPVKLQIPIYPSSPSSFIRSEERAKIVPDPTRTEQPKTISARASLRLNYKGL
jgi:hypothetical protein